MENTKFWWKGPSSKQQPCLGGLLTHAHHNLEENHSYFSQQLFKKGSSPLLLSCLTALPLGSVPAVPLPCATSRCSPSSSTPRRTSSPISPSPPGSLPGAEVLGALMEGQKLAVSLPAALAC